MAAEDDALLAGVTVGAALVQRKLDAG